MGKGLDFVREIVGGVIDERMVTYGVCKTVDILLDLKTEDEKIKQMLVKHFDIRYSEAENVLIEAKEYRKNNIFISTSIIQILTQNYKASFSRLAFAKKGLLKTDSNLDLICRIWYNNYGTSCTRRAPYGGGCFPSVKGAKVSFSPFNKMEGGGNHVHHIGRITDVSVLAYRSRRVFR